MPNKLTDTEIKKALECCIQNTKCHACPMWNTGQNCMNRLYQYALDLINRLETVNEKNENIIRIADKTIATQQAENESLKAEVERLKTKNAVIMKQALAENKTTATAIMKETKQHIMTAEKIKKLEEDNERLKNHIQEGIDLAKQIPEMLALAKAEAYKECIEKVMETALVIKKNAFQGCYVISKGNLDNLLNELVGDALDS